MVKAGEPTDAVINELADAWKKATSSSTAATPTSPTPSAARRRSASSGLHFVGVGVSGGEEGALTARRSCRAVRPSPTSRSGPLLEEISAHVDGTPCCTHIGPDGAGHFVKMVHNGIEYADMQLIARGLPPAARRRSG